MSGRRRVTRATASAEPVGDLGPRQTRRSAKRAEAGAEVSVEPEPRPQTEIPQRGIRRGRRRRSLESIATNDFPKSSASHASPGPENRGLAPVSDSIVAIPVPESIEVIPLAETEAVEESVDIDPGRVEDMLDYDIPKLMRWSDRIYDKSLSLGNQQLEADDWSATKKRHKAALAMFTEDKEPFFVKLIDLSKYDPGVQAKVQAGICSGNLASLLIYIVDVKLGTQMPQLVLEMLDDAFPILFDSNPKADANETERILDLGFRIRYRRLFELIAADVSSKPTILAASVFCTQHARDVKGARAALTNGPYSWLAGIDINTDVDYYKNYRSHIQDLASTLTSNNALEVMDQKYTQEELFDDIRLWALEIYQRLNRSIEPMAASPAQGSHANVEHEGSEALLVDDNHETRAESDSESDTDDEGYDQLPQQEANQNIIDSLAISAPKAIRQSEIMAAARLTTATPSDRQAPEGKGKGKAVDIGDAIRRLDPGQLLDRSQKRARYNESNDDEDDDFEVNGQLGESPRIPRKRDTIVQPPPSKRPRVLKQAQASGSQPQLSQSPAPRRTASEHQQDDLPNDTNVRRRDILALSQGAQNTRRANIPVKPRQVRVPWTDPEIARLLKLIADPNLKCSWSAMEELGGFDNFRNQQALRDKARGLKVWYLEGDYALPAGFDQVALGQKERNAVIKCHKNPDRREDDLNEDGRITNNVWAEEDDAEIV